MFLRSQMHQNLVFATADNKKLILIITTSFCHSIISGTKTAHLQFTNEQL